MSGVTQSPDFPAPLTRCRVVLVRPKIAANVGATARVMRNMGLTDLVLVRPEVDLDDPRGRLLATHSADILDRARIFDELGAAVADCGLVAATSARVGGLLRRQSVGSPVELMPHLLEVAARHPVALVFGPEASGLRDEEVTRCHYLIHIPTDPVHPALNLAQAVAVCLYELRRCWCLLNQIVSTTAAEPAPFADQERMFNQLREALEEVHFLYGPKADALMHALRHLIGRAGPTPMEVDLLLGLARQLRWVRRQMREGEAP
jgi:tRNA/rRNA methyltransferase